MIVFCMELHVYVNIFTYLYVASVRSIIMNSTQLNDSKIPCSTFMKTVCDASNTKSETNIKDRVLKKLNRKPPTFTVLPILN